MIVAVSQKENYSLLIVFLDLRMIHLLSIPLIHHQRKKLKYLHQILIPFSVLCITMSVSYARKRLQKELHKRLLSLYCNRCKMGHTIKHARCCNQPWKDAAAKSMLKILTKMSLTVNRCYIYTENSC